MIKKLVAVVLLMGAGFTVLYLATGGESLASFGAGETVGQEPETGAPGIRVPIGDEQEGETGENLTVSYRGELEINELREITLSDGSHRHIELYKLHSNNSFPRNDGTWELQDVTVRFYETRGTPEEPIAVEAGVLRAQLAYVEIGKDNEGNRSVAMDKDIVLDRAVLVTGEHARIKNLSMTMERALVRSTESALFVRTADDNMPFEIEIAAADGPATLSGRGLTAEFPVSEEPGQPRPMIIEVTRDPVLIHRGAHGDSRLAADGPLTYRENADTGIAHISAEGHVQIDSAGALVTSGSSAGAEAQSLIASGDRLRATLRRSPATTGSGSPRVAWRSMHLVGSAETPAGLVGRGMVLTCDAVDVTPNIEGEPWLFTASGKPRLEHEENGRTMRFAAAERIHLVRIAPHLSPWLRGRGWSRWTASPQLGELLIFEGASSLELPHGEDLLTLHAQDGLRVLRGLEGTGQMTVLGLGEVQLDSDGTEDRLHLTGSDGFLLHVDVDGQTLRLGPRTTNPHHRFELATADMTARGSGAFTLVRPAATDQPGEITLSSPNSDIELTIPGTEGRLGQVATLTAAFGQGQMRQFDARGTACRLLWQGEQGQIDGTAVRIHSETAETWILRGSPAVVVSDRGTFEGAHIRIVQLTEKDTLLEATGQARLRAKDFGLVGAPAESDGQVDLTADRILYLPFAAPAAAATQLVWPEQPTSLLTPHLLAWRDVVVQHLDAKGHPVNHARGETLVVEIGDAPTGQLRGSPAVVTRRDPAGQSVVAIAPVVTFAGSGGQDLSLIPTDGGQTEITIGNRRGPLATLGQTEGTTRIVCTGPIDVAEDQVLFGGPVTVTSLGPDGEDEPDGFHAAAERMRMGRNPETGEFESIHTSNGTALRWRGIKLRGSEVSLDLVRHWCSLRDRDNRASLTLPSGYSGRCSRAEFNYLTYESKVWGIWMTEDRATK